MLRFNYMMLTVMTSLSVLFLSSLTISSCESKHHLTQWFSTFFSHGPLLLLISFWWNPITIWWKSLFYFLLIYKFTNFGRVEALGNTGPMREGFSRNIRPEPVNLLLLFFWIYKWLWCYIFNNLQLCLAWCYRIYDQPGFKNLM
jgi:hypothetical protein